MKKVVVLRYAEIGLKGRNRGDFERALLENIEAFIGRKVERKWGRFYVEMDWEKEDMSIFKRIFGIQNFSPAYLTQLDFDAMKGAALDLAKREVESGKKTFKINARRINKNFPMSVYDINSKLGAAVLKELNVSVDVHRPEFTIGVEVRDEGAVIFSKKEEGAGGLPVGVSGKGLLLLSGGIDSPVAGWFAMKRGIEISAISFISPPYTGKETKSKIIQLAKVLKSYLSGKALGVYFCPLTPVLEFLQDHVPRKYMLLMQRRSMMRIASKIASQLGAQVLITGESIGQVASQTLQNLSVIEEAAQLLVLRPLCCFDKLEIIQKAKEIGTYEISTIEHPDVCTIFSPKRPSTKARLSVVKEIESQIQDQLLRKEEEACAFIEKVVVGNGKGADS